MYQNIKKELKNYYSWKTYEKEKKRKEKQRKKEFFRKNDQKVTKIFNILLDIQKEQEKKGQLSQKQIWHFAEILNHLAKDVYIPNSVTWVLSFLPDPDLTEISKHLTKRAQKNLTRLLQHVEQSEVK